MTDKQQTSPSSLPFFVFTPETMHMTQEALKLFEQSLQRTDHQRPRVAFAAETLKRVKGKLDAMNMPGNCPCLVSFDYNEKVVIVAAIQLHILDLNALSASPQCARKLQQCKQIVAYFAPDNAMNGKDEAGRKQLL